MRTITLNEAERIDVVRQDGEEKVILAVVEEHQSIQKRTAVYLTLKQANKLARDLAGISVMIGVQEDTEE